MDLFTKKHIVSAQDIKNTFPDMDSSTVYRTLKRLQVAKVIKEVVLNSNKAYYELAHDNHAHFICNSCEKIEAVPLSFSPTIPNHTVQNVKVEFSGLCPQCK